MRTIAGVLALMLFASLAARAEDAEKTWELKGPGKAIVGQKSDVVRKTSMKVASKVTENGKVESDGGIEGTGSYEFTVEVTAVDGDRMTGGKWTFRKATHTVKDKTDSWGFEGKTITGTCDEDGEWEYTHEDGSLAVDEELEGIGDAVGKHNRKDKDEQTPEKIFLPKKPVKIGESWTPDIEAITKSFGGEQFTADAANSTGTCTLKSVENRDGANFAVIELEMRLSVDAHPPAKLDKPFECTMHMKVEISTDGTRRDRTISAAMKMAGTRTVTAELDKKVQSFELVLSLENTSEESATEAK